MEHTCGLCPHEKRCRAFGLASGEMANVMIRKSVSEDFGTFALLVQEESEKYGIPPEKLWNFAEELCGTCPFCGTGGKKP